MAITRQEAQEQIIDALAVAVEDIALAVACFSEAYEQLPDDSADQLEAELFRPAQKAYGRAKNTRDGFAARFDLAAPEPEAAAPGLKSQGAKVFIEKAVAYTSAADGTIAQLQDTMLPVESGDPELREGLAVVREGLNGLPSVARNFLRTLGR